MSVGFPNVKVAYACRIGLASKRRLLVQVSDSFQDAASICEKASVLESNRLGTEVRQSNPVDVGNVGN